METHYSELIYIAIAFALGGILKGATGAGAPIIAVPVLVLIYDVQTAVTVFAIPNLVPNLWQSWTYRAHQLPRRLACGFAVSGAAGIVIGTIMLAYLPGSLLTLIVAFAVMAYVAFRLLRPQWVLALDKAVSIVIPVGLVGGMLQGSAGLSAPVSITFLNAMKPTREQFIATISLFFAALGIAQLPMIIGLGLMDGQRFVQSCLALVPLLAFMPVGSYLARRISRETFDKIILVLLIVIALRLLAQSL